jgi:hypothetical protein
MRRRGMIIRRWSITIISMGEGMEGPLLKGEELGLGAPCVGPYSMEGIVLLRELVIICLLVVMVVGRGHCFY